MLVGLGYAAGGHPTFGWAAALLAVFTAYVRAMAKVAGAPQDYCGPMAKPHRMFLATLLGVYNAVTPESWQRPFGSWELGPSGWILIVICLGCVVTSWRRLLRAARYLKDQSG